MLNTIKATPFSYDQHSKDSPMWGFSKNGCFSLQSAYLLARGLNPLNLDTMPFTWVWKTKAPPKIQFLIWLCVHNSLPMAEVLGSRGLILDPMCKVCNRSNKSIEHLLRDCEIAHKVWQELQVPYCLRDSFTLPIRNWFEVNCKSRMSSKFMGIYWRILFLMGVWQLWLY